MSYDPSQVIFVDTETTGLHPDNHAIWEIAVIRDGKELSWQQILPGGSQWRKFADPWVLENMPRIETEYDRKKAQTPYDSVMAFVEMARGRHVVGCNVRFDIERLHRLARMYDPKLGEEPWHYHLIDVEALMLGRVMEHNRLQQGQGPSVEPEAPLPWKTTDLAMRCGVEPESDIFQPKHSALADVRFAKACFEAVFGPPVEAEVA